MWVERKDVTSVVSMDTGTADCLAVHSEVSMVAYLAAQ